MADITKILASDTVILASTIQTITSDAIIPTTTTQIASSNGVVLATMVKTVSTDAFIKLPVIFQGAVQVTKPQEGEFLAETEVLNPIPSAPTNLVAVDVGLGDAINLSWVSSANFFNVYKKVGAVHTKLNANIISGTTTYMAGGLTTDVPVSFVVRAVNGIDQESVDSNVASATPTLDTNAPRFTNPTWTVHINDVLQPLAILDSVELAFGSEMSSASFSLPIDPRGTTPALGSTVKVTVNGKIIFKGPITVKSSSVDLNGLLMRYSCTSNILKLTESTLFSTDIYGANTIFNATIVPPDGKPFTRNPATVASLLSAWGISGAPAAYPGHIDVTDSTRLAAAELVLSRIGNYRLYHDMVTEITSVYAFGSHGLTTREFQFAKNIKSYNIDESTIDVVKQITLIGGVGTTHVTQMMSPQSMAASADPDGRLALNFVVSGAEIQNIQVFGLQREKDSVVYDDDIQVTLADFVGFGESSDAFKAAFGNTSFGWVNYDGTPLDNNATANRLFPHVKYTSHLSAQWTGLGAKVVYDGTSKATVYLNEVPKMWYSVFKNGPVKRVTVGQQSVSPSDTIDVQILLGYDWQAGSIRVEYDVATAPPVVVAGSGTPSRTITDSQYTITINPNITETGATVATRMNARALAELAQHNIPTLSGSITVLGDETIDLRTGVRVNGQVLEVGRVSHNFTEGYTTTIQLTNERFLRQTVFQDTIYTTKLVANKDERARKTVWYNFINEQQIKLKENLAAEKDKINKEASSSGKYALYQD